MTKKIAVINDLSGFGRCSLVAAISAISAMGSSPCPLPTAVLSSQTGYPSYFCDDYTDKMTIFQQEWEKLQVHFDGIYTGFVASEAQILHIFEFLDRFQEEDTFLLVDPVMGDNGRSYDMFTPKLCERMKELVLCADYITPNLTELCLLTDADYPALARIEDPVLLSEKIRTLAHALIAQGPHTVIVTGIHFKDPETGIAQMGNLSITKEQCKMQAFPYIGGSYSGTGDLFASILTGGIARGDSPDDLVRLAATFIETAMKDSAKEQVPANDGVNYEPYLWMLTRKGDIS